MPTDLNMLNRDRVFSLQGAQQKHDDVYHRDIANLPTADRVKHMTLHFSKYVGYLGEALRKEDGERVQKVLVDAFIITLATANALSQELEMQSMGAERDGDQQASDVGLLIDFAVITGQMAKACESLDHLESVSFRDVLQTSNQQMFTTVVQEAARRGMDIRERYFERIRQVEAKSFHRRLTRTKVT